MEKIKVRWEPNVLSGNVAFTLEEIASNENAILYVLKILNHERKETNELVSDFNMELSRMDVMFKEPKLGGETKAEREVFRIKNIDAFYDKWSHRVKHLFKKQNG